MTCHVTNSHHNLLFSKIKEHNFFSTWEECLMLSHQRNVQITFAFPVTKSISNLKVSEESFFSLFFNHIFMDNLAPWLWQLWGKKIYLFWRQLQFTWFDLITKLAVSSSQSVHINSFYWCITECSSSSLPLLIIFFSLLPHAFSSCPSCYLLGFIDLIVKP